MIPSLTKCTLLFPAKQNATLAWNCVNSFIVVFTIMDVTKESRDADIYPPVCGKTVFSARDKDLLSLTHHCTFKNDESNMTLQAELVL